MVMNNFNYLQLVIKNRNILPEISIRCQYCKQILNYQMIYYFIPVIEASFKPEIAFML